MNYQTHFQVVGIGCSIAGYGLYTRLGGVYSVYTQLDVSFSSLNSGDLNIDTSNSGIKNFYIQAYTNIGP